MDKIDQLREEVLHKQRVLQNANATLKREFIGLDRVINAVTDAIASWYLFPDLQEKPLVINLWGLTGVGKSSLVNRLALLLQFEKQFFNFDLGEDGQSEYAVKQQLERIYEFENGYPVMLALDEFQHARTIDDTGCEIADPKHRVIWQLLDSGRFQMNRFAFGMSDLHDLMIDLNLHLAAGVKVKDGVVTHKVARFRSQRSLNDMVDQPDTKSRNNNADLLFVPATYYERIYEHARELFDSFLDVRARLLQLDGPGTVRFLKEVLACINSPKEVDCSKGLIFVLGNLDEAYHMSGDQNADIGADEFHEQSLKINLPEIKKALTKRFRHEQIGRLGNQHIIYPAHSADTFRKIIDLELSRVTKKVSERFSIDAHFHQSLKELIYREGVFPTQGTRPLQTTIYQVVQSRLGAVVAEMLAKNLRGCSVHFRAHSKGVLVEFRADDAVKHHLLFEQEFALEKLRSNQRDDVQAITAVHESGHAILSSLLLRTVPEVVLSTTAKKGATGLALVKTRWKYVSRDEITNRLATFLGGMAAEQVVFGNDRVTTGASSDIERATEFVTEMLKDCGMGTQIGSFSEPSPNSLRYVYDDDRSLNGEAKEWLARARQLAEETLRREEKLLLRMADRLSDHRQLDRTEIIDLMKRHAVAFDEGSLVENGDRLFYRDHLKRKVRQISEPLNEQSSLKREQMVLNRKVKH